MTATTGFDVVVIGGGSAGAVVSARLSADPTRRVLLIEAGADFPAAQTPAAVRGGNFLRALAVGRLRWPGVLAQLTAVQQPRAYVCGRGIGGGSVINGQSAIRGLPGDFDRWGSDCPRWAWAQVGPAFAAVEDDLDFPAAPYHGRGGPVPVSRGTREPWGSASLALAQAARELGHPEHGDINAPGATGVSPMAFNRRTGQRASTKDSFVEPARDRINLEIQPGTTALRLRFRHQRCVGVEVATPAGRRLIPAAGVVVCAGAIHSPALLLRSGIGPAGQLGALGIAVVADRPGVGANLADHPTAWLTFALTDQARLANADALPGRCALRFSSRVPGASADDLQLFACDYQGGSTAAGGLMVALLDPVSTGRVVLRSADPTVEPEISFGMLGESQDVARMAAGLREALRVLVSAPFGRVLAGPARLSTGLRADELETAELADVLRHSVTSYNHAAGTCRMGSPTAPDTVVDANGAVLGVQGVWVADASVMPHIVRAPTHLTTVMLADRLSRAIAAPRNGSS